MTWMEKTSLPRKNGNISGQSEINPPQGEVKQGINLAMLKISAKQEKADRVPKE